MRKSRDGVAAQRYSAGPAVNTTHTPSQPARPQTVSFCSRSIQCADTEEEAEGKAAA